MNDNLQVFTLTAIIWVGAVVAATVGLMSHVLNAVAKYTLLGICKINRKLGQKEVCYRYGEYPLSGFDIAKYAGGIVLASVTSDETIAPMQQHQNDGKSSTDADQGSWLAEDTHKQAGDEHAPSRNSEEGLELGSGLMEEPSGEVKSTEAPKT